MFVVSGISVSGAEIDVDTVIESTFYEPTEEVSSETQATESTTETVATKITLKKASAKIYQGESVNIKVNIKNGVGTTKYVSLNKKIATVNAKGKVTAKKVGTATIRISNNNEYKFFTVIVRKNFEAENTAKGIKLTWKKLQKSGKYTIYRSNSKNKGYEAIGKTNKTSFVDKKVKATKAYYYKLKAANGKSYKAIKVVHLKAPKMKSIELTKSGNIKIKWSKVNGAKKYRVYYAEKIDGEMDEYTSYGTTKKTQKTDYPYGTARYYYKVTAVNGNSESAMSNALSIDYIEPPLFYVSVNEDHTGMDINFYEEDGVDGYKVYRSSDKDSTKQLLAKIKAEDVEKVNSSLSLLLGDVVYRDFTCEYGVTYTYYMSSYKGKKESKLEDGLPVKFTRADIELKVGESNAELKDSIVELEKMEADLKITFEVDNENPEVISISEDGVITALAPGEAAFTLTLSVSQGRYSMTQTAKITVYVTE